MGSVVSKVVGKVFKTVDKLTGGLLGINAAEQQAEQAAQAAALQKAEIKKQEVLQKKQDVLVAEEKAKEEAETKERKTRLARGRKGLLYGAETGVEDQSAVLGG